MAGDDHGLARAAAEVPNWTISAPDLEGGQFRAHSPTHHVDGVIIVALDPRELVARVRTMERLVALAAGRGTRPPGGVVAGVEVLAPASPAPVPAPQAPQERAAPSGLPFPPAAPSGPLQTRQAARAAGFLGDPCPECQALTMVQNGSCSKCTSCGATTGCS